MFEKSIYVERREKLKEYLKSGLVLFPGNKEVVINYFNYYRQDSNFLYYWGHESPMLWGIIDIDNDKDYLFGDDRQIDDVVWMGPDSSMAQKANAVGAEAMPYDDIAKVIAEAIKGGKKIHYLPQYDANIILFFESVLKTKHTEIGENVSVDFIKAVVAQRQIKTVEEVEQIVQALDTSYLMNTFAMKQTKPGYYEREIYGALEGITLSQGSDISFPMIFSVRGETLHNNNHDNLMKEGDLVLLDSGAESLLHYASDITRTFPVSGKFTDKQKDIYNIVLKSQLDAIEQMNVDVPFRDCHLTAAKVIATGLKEIGLMKGDVDEAVSNGAHALFFPHGLGHMMGLDVHDMEPLGENYVGYDDEFKRSDQFGLAYLRMAKRLKSGFVMTVEPGIYFIPQLIANWQSEKKHADFINYDKIQEYLGFGGIRIEDDVLVTNEGPLILGKSIPKTVEEVEAVCNS